MSIIFLTGCSISYQEEIACMVGMPGETLAVALAETGLPESLTGSLVVSILYANIHSYIRSVILFARFHKLTVK